MKNFLIAAVVMTGLSACEGPPGKDGRDGRDGLVSTWHNITFTVHRDDWQLVGGENQIGSYYWSLWDDVPQLTDAIYREGAVICYYEFADDQGEKVLTTLPYTYYDMDIVEEEGGKETEYPFSVHYSYDVTPGSIAFKLTFSDFYTGAFRPPPECTFKLVLVY
ncbi:MAG: hypothetical protein LBR08_07660 [Bacteroidales bacterium]|nr:hypothetical protein [Bacteroidales bacterium]